MFLLLFLFVGGLFIISNQNLKLNSQKNLDLFFTEYRVWLNDLVDNTKTVSGFLIKMEWLPETNKSFG